jgi:HEPN domain-containing protein
MSSRGQIEFERLRDLAWGLVHGDGASAFIKDGQKNYFRDWDFLAHGFKNAADHIAALALERWPNSDYLWYPLCYNYRHFAELTLKACCYELVSQTPRGHDLISLWSRCKAELSELLSEEEAELAFEQIENVIVCFNLSDPNSARFRYPVSSERSVEVQINIHELVYFMEVFEMAITSLVESVRARRHALDFAH